MKSVLLILGLILLVAPAYSQTAPGTGTFGLTAQFSGIAAASDVATMSNGLNALYIVAPNVVLLGGISLTSISDAATIFGFDVGAYYRLHERQFTPIFGGAIILNIVSPKGANSTTSFGIVLGGGAAYYVSKNFGMNLTEGLQFSSNPSTFAFVTKMGIDWYF